MNKLVLPELPYSYDALEPVISKSIVELHHDKHHLTYVNGANTAIEKLEKFQKGEMEIDVKAVIKDYSFHYNGALLHDLYWKNMRAPANNSTFTENVRNKLDQNFGSVESFTKIFNLAAIGVEGSGWTVLWQLEDRSLMVGQLEKHNLLGINKATPLLVLDVWEHAYYLDYLNDRKSYVEKWWTVVDWTSVEDRLV